MSIDFKSAKQSLRCFLEDTNNVWTFGMSVLYGTEGFSSEISVYDPIFKSREDALNHAVKKLKHMMTEKLGGKDTTNYNQKIIKATLRSIQNL